MKKDDLYKKIREGSEEEAKKAFETLMANVSGAHTVSIMARNFSHNIGVNIKRRKKRKSNKGE